MVVISECIPKSIEYLWLIARIIFENPNYIFVLFVLGAILAKTKLLKYIIGFTAAFFGAIGGLVGWTGYPLIGWFIGFFGKILPYITGGTVVGISTSAQIQLIMAPIMTLFTFFVIMESKTALKGITAIISALLSPLFLLSPVFMIVYLALMVFIILFASKYSEYTSLIIPIIYAVIILLILTVPTLGFCNLLTDFMKEPAILDYLKTPIKLPFV